MFILECAVMMEHASGNGFTVRDRLRLGNPGGIFLWLIQEVARHFTGDLRFLGETP